MGWLTSAAVTALLVLTGIQMASLIAAASADVANRLIPNAACITVALAGAAARLLAGPLAFAESAVVAAGLFLMLLFLHARSVLGGGDVKLLTAAVVGQSPAGALHLLSATALAGGVLALLHLGMRQLPRPALAPAGSALWRRVYAAERWRILRHAPLPYGVAIACGGIWTILTHTGS